jgi:hypothetical protein
MNRDMNACLNILKIAEEWINTKTRLQKLVQKVFVEKTLCFSTQSVEILTLSLKKHKTWLISCFY